jgi:hypothetical protein
VTRYSQFQHFRTAMPTQSYSNCGLSSGSRVRILPGAPIRTPVQRPERAANLHKSGSMFIGRTEEFS